jgi:hypothetical protein
LAETLSPNGPPAVVGELALVQELRREHADAFARITKDKAGYYNGFWKRADRIVTKADLKCGGALGGCSFIGVFAGLGCGAFAEHELGFAHDASVLVGLGAFATGVAVMPLANLIGMFSRRAEARAGKKLVGQDSIRPQLDAFTEAGGAEKATRGALLGAWLAELNARRAVQPPARVALEGVRKTTDALPPEQRQRVELLAQLGALVESASTNKTVVQDLAAWRERWPQGPERCDLIIAAIDAIEGSGRDIDYDAAHALYDLRMANERDRESAQAEPAL